MQIDCTECLARICEGAGTLSQSPVHSRRASEILALVELLASALFAYHLLVARYESFKESSVSVCHNSK